MKPMNKKGVEMSIQAIIVMVLGLIVLVILIMVIRGQIGKGTMKYTNITASAEQEFKKGDRCTGFFTGRICTDKACSNTDYKITVPPPPAPGWADCKHNCCERA